MDDSASYPPTVGTWEQYHLLIMNELERHNEVQKLFDSKLDRLNESLNDKLDTVQGSLNEKLDQIRTDDLPSLRTEIANLKVRASIWGVVGGSIAAILPPIAAILLRLLH